MAEVQRTEKEHWNGLDLFGSLLLRSNGILHCCFFFFFFKTAVLKKKKKKKQQFIEEEYFFYKRSFFKIQPIQIIWDSSRFGSRIIMLWRTRVKKDQQIYLKLIIQILLRSSKSILPVQIISFVNVGDWKSQHLTNYERI